MRLFAVAVLPALGILFILQVIAQTLEREVKGFTDLFHRHSEFGAVALWLWSVVCQAIPAPTAGGSWVHATFYNLAHLAAGNLRLLGKRAGGEGYIDRRRTTGSFSQKELDQMTRKAPSDLR